MKTLLKPAFLAIFCVFCFGSTANASSYWDGAFIAFKPDDGAAYAALPDNPNSFGVDMDIVDTSADAIKIGQLKITRMAVDSPFRARGLREGDVIFAADLKYFPSAQALAKYITTRPQYRLLSLHYKRPSDADEHFVVDVSRRLAGGL